MIIFSLEKEKIIKLYEFSRHGVAIQKMNPPNHYLLVVRLKMMKNLLMQIYQ
jgi:hypothetical protein